jgi:hypothetical protein
MPGPEIDRARRLDPELGQQQRHDRAQHRERPRHDELNADHDPKRALPLHRGGTIRLGGGRFLYRAALLFAHHSAAPNSAFL